MTDSTESDIVERLRVEASECRFEGLYEAASHLEAAAAEIAKLRAERDAAARDMRPISDAKKDGSRILVLMRSNIPNTREDLRRWDGVPFVARHNGVAADGFDIGWQFAAPVGCGGFPDEWLAGWWPLPAACSVIATEGDSHE